MKKFKFVLINVFFLVILYFFLDFVCLEISLNRARPFWNGDRNFIQYFVDLTKEVYPTEYISFNEKYKYYPFRPVSGSEYKDKKPIVLFGCSYAYGAGLKVEETFSHTLAIAGKREVYNRAGSGWGVQNMLYQLKREDFYKKIKREPEFVIYLYIDPHIQRLYREVFTTDIQMFYKENKNGDLQETFLESGFPMYSYLTRQIKYFFVDSFLINPNNNVKIQHFLEQHFIESHQQIQKHWKNTKFCIFVYGEKKIINELCFEELKKQGINVIYLSDLTNEDMDTLKYKLSKIDAHPNKYAWQLISPLIAKKLNL